MVVQHKLTTLSAGIRKTKDAGAGAVLVAAVAAAVVGAIVFLPKIWEFTAKWFEE